MFGHSSISDTKFQHVASVLAGLKDFYGTQPPDNVLLQNGLTMMKTAVLISLLLSQRSLSLFGLEMFIYSDLSTNKLFSFMYPPAG